MPQHEAERTPQHMTQRMTECIAQLSGPDGSAAAGARALLRHPPGCVAVRRFGRQRPEEA